MKITLIKQGAPEAWFEHAADPANLHFRVSVHGSVLRIAGANCAYGPQLLKMERIEPHVVEVSIPFPNPPKPSEPVATIEALREQLRHVTKQRDELYTAMELAGLSATQIAQALRQARGESPDAT